VSIGIEVVVVSAPKAPKDRFTVLLDLAIPLPRKVIPLFSDAPIDSHPVISTQSIQIVDELSDKLIQSITILLTVLFIALAFKIQVPIPTKIPVLEGNVEGVMDGVLADHGALFSKSRDGIISFINFHLDSPF
jgi:hypothetical protein